MLISIGAIQQSEQLLVTDGLVVERVVWGVDRLIVKGLAAAVVLIAAATDSLVSLGPLSPIGPKC